MSFFNHSFSTVCSGIKAGTHLKQFIEGMKKIALGLLSLGLLTACTDDNNNGNNEPLEKDCVLRARIESTESVTTRMMVDNDNQLHWEDVDEIGVYSLETQNVRFSYLGSQNGITEFTGDLDANQEEFAFAYYPYQEGAVKSGNSLTVELPSEYVYKGNSNAPMLGVKTDDGTFLFKHACGLIHVTLGELPSDVDRFVITACGDNAPSLAGMATIENIHADNACLVVDEEGSRSVTYHLGQLTRDDELKHVFVPLPVGNYTQLEISLYGTQGAESYFTKTLSNLSIRRTDVVDVSVINDLTGDYYILNKAARELTSKTALHISLSGVDNEMLVYDASTPAEEIPQVGQILISKAFENIPDGFLGRVTEVNKGSDGSYSVRTEQVALSEAFDKLYINESVDLISKDSKQAHTRGLKGSIWEEPFSYEEFTLDHGLKDQSIKTKGYLSIGGKLDINIQIDKDKRLEDFTFILTEYAGISTLLDMAMFATQPNTMKIGFPESQFECIRVADGLVTLTPSASSSFVVEGIGRINTQVAVNSQVKYNRKNTCQDGRWSTEDMAEEDLVNQESPWDLTSGLTFDGSLRVGVESKWTLKAYNNEEQSFSMNPTLTNTLSGKIELDKSTPSSIESSLQGARLTSAMLLGGCLVVRPSLLGTKEGNAPISLPFSERKEAKKTISAFPSFKPLEVDVHRMSGNGNLFEADINTELRGEVFSRLTQVRLVIADKAGNEIATSNHITYKGGKTFKEEPDVVETLENIFAQLPADEEYIAYPRVKSPLFVNLAEDRAIDLKGKKIEFDTHSPVETLGGEISQSGDYITFLGGFDPNTESVSEYGFCYTTDASEPRVDNGRIVASKHTQGKFSAVLQPVAKNTTYNFRAYLIVAGEIYYGDIKKIATENNLLIGKWKLIKNEGECIYDGEIEDGYCRWSWGDVAINADSTIVLEEGAMLPRCEGIWYMYNAKTLVFQYWCDRETLGFQCIIKELTEDRLLLYCPPEFFDDGDDAKDQSWMLATFQRIE